jgi:uncharacterized membrane protein YdfJ with MMPL/SSD domain
MTRLERLSRLCYRRRRRVLAAWILAFIGMTILGRSAGGELSTEFSIPGSESQRAADVLEDRFPARSGDTIDVVFKSDAGINDPATKTRVERLLGEMAGVAHVAAVASPYSPQGAQSVSRDGKIAFAVLQLDLKGSDMPKEDTLVLLDAAKAASDDSLRFELGGLAVQNAEFVQGGGEVLGLLAAMIILLIVFGSLLAMGLPILTAVMGIGIGLAIVELLAHVVNVPDFALVMAAMIGIGVGIDYALFIVTRYRLGLADDMDPEEATIVAISTAGRAVLFAGTTVVISVLGILLMNLPILQGVAIGSAAAVAVTMLGAVTLVPALLGFSGRSIDRLRVPFVKPPAAHQRTGFWFRWSRFVQRRPWPAFIAGALAIGLLTLPLFSLRLGVPGADSQPEDRSVRRSYELFVEGFGPGFAAPLILAADLSAGGRPETLGRLETRLREEPGVAAVAPPQLNPTGDAAVMTVFPTTGGQSIETERLVHHLRDVVIPSITDGSGVEISIGGPNAAFIDSSEAISARLPIFIAVVVGLSFVLLMAVFRSVLVALKAAIMNLLSIGAAYGVVVAVAQWGWLKDIFGISQAGPVTNFIPMIMFAILFGLSMDYEVFLLSRIREEYQRSGDNSLAVADGLAATARVITAAALIMITVFLAFVIGPELVIKQMGLGLAAAVFIDATLIRMVLVPSSMELMGRANWWLPGWLGRILPNVNFEATPTRRAEQSEEQVPVTSGSGRRTS